MPLLQQSSVTNIVIIDPPRHGPDRSDPGGMLSQMIARHGVRAEGGAARWFGSIQDRFKP